MIALWHWLEAQGLLHDLVNDPLNVALVAVAAWRPWRTHRKAQRQAAQDRALTLDRLDTSTPGGLGDLIHQPPKGRP